MVLSTALILEFVPWWGFGRSRAVPRRGFGRSRARPSAPHWANSVGPPLQGGCPSHGCVAIRPAWHLGVRELALKGPRCAQSLRGIARLCAIHGSELLRASCAQPFGLTRLFAIPGYESIAPSSRLPLVRRLAGVDVFLVGARPEIPHLRHRLPPSLLGVPVYACVARRLLAPGALPNGHSEDVLWEEFRVRSHFPPISAKHAISRWTLV